MVRGWLVHHNANTHWAYPTSVETDPRFAAVFLLPRLL
jgi:hypothetical protein